MKTVAKHPSRKARREALRASWRKYAAECRREAKANGFCVYCFKRPTDGRSRCDVCRAYESEWRKRTIAALPEGVCHQCRKRPTAPNRKRCEKCLARRRRYHKQNSQPGMAWGVVERNILTLLARGRRAALDITGEIGCTHRSTLRRLAELGGRGLIERWVSDDGEVPITYVKLTRAGIAEVNRMADEIRSQILEAA